METQRKRLKFLCKDRGIKQVTISDKLGVSEALISRFINGTRDLNPIKQIELTEILKNYKGIK